MPGKSHEQRSGRLRSIGLQSQTRLKWSLLVPILFSSHSFGSSLYLHTCVIKALSAITCLISSMTKVWTFSCWITTPDFVFLRDWQYVNHGPTHFDVFFFMFAWYAGVTQLVSRFLSEGVIACVAVDWCVHGRKCVKEPLITLSWTRIWRLFYS